jgi:hypothetical protein
MKPSLGSVRAPIASFVTAAVFVVLAKVAGDAPPVAVAGGAVWVFILTTIVTLPLFSRRSGDRAE